MSVVLSVRIGIIMMVTILTATASHGGQATHASQELRMLSDGSGGGYEFAMASLREVKSEVVPEAVCRARTAACANEIAPFYPVGRGELSIVGGSLGALVGTLLTKSPAVAISLGAGGAIAAGRMEKYVWERTEAYCRARHC